ncbi:Cytochrome P450 [Mycena venus]|uniref:Cytochrome P450 n=1 Tax=Mycena venus TaxID=2733690 RepID=A0A8H6Y6D0_9AGAR|nr:Cytochrome P450 [Mycena venus]
MVPKRGTWKYFEKLSHQYGPIVKVRMAGNDFVVLSHPSDVEELASGYEEMQYKESLRLLVDLVKSPAEFYKHCARFPASLVFSLTYGKGLGDDGKDLAEVQSIFTTFIRDVGPGAHLVDTFPVLDLLPDFLSPWRAEARQKHKWELEVYGRLALTVKARMGKDSEMECFVARLWEQQEKLNLSNEEIYYSKRSFFAGSAFAAGTDPATLTLLWFVVAMALYPETAKKAQQEIDSVFESDVLPSFSRMKDLPYCSALVKEVFRWRPAAPLSIPHYTDADDEYKGYKSSSKSIQILKGTTVIGCVWNMHHNEEDFPNSYTFNPERYLSKASDTGDIAESLTEGHYGFGFGRRKCPGQHMAAKSEWIAMVRILWGFNIERRMDAAGNIMDIDIEDCTPGLTARPKEFPVNFVPRSAAHIETIMLNEGRI